MTYSRQVLQHVVCNKPLPTTDAVKPTRLVLPGFVLQSLKRNLAPPRTSHASEATHVILEDILGDESVIALPQAQQNFAVIL